MNDLSRETGALLDEGRDGESLSPADKMRLKRAVLAQVAAASVVGTTSTAAAWSTTAKAVGAILFVTSAAGGTAALVASQSKATKAPQTMSTVSRGASTTSTTRSAIAFSPPVLPTSVASPAPPPPAGPLAKPSLTPRAASLPAPIPVNAVPSPVSPAPPASSLEVETALLREADDALKLGDPNRALGLLAQLANRFPQSALAPERSAERVFALCMAGRADDAKQEAGAFLTVQPTGPLALRVRASCGGDKP